eukprot:TRINITY_DN9380_c0_g1_i1.p1 TRINITY_DN9380_c0_g1~~TRINITY_DN9380_c0_g1_i1.p1  ORF type:complete len:428 (-),score=71.20 TRINITY_DN9380_c0_g1_i1:118-1401(-)
MSLDSLEGSICLEILRFCCADSLLHVRQVCKKLRDLITSNTEFVHSIFEARTGTPAQTCFSPIKLLHLLKLNDRLRNKPLKYEQISLVNEIQELQPSLHRASICADDKYIILNPVVFHDFGWSSTNAVVCDANTLKAIGTLPSGKGFCDIFHSPNSGDFLLSLLDSHLAVMKIEAKNISASPGKMKSSSSLRVFRTRDARSHCFFVKEGWIVQCFPDRIELYYLSDEILETGSSGALLSPVQTVNVDYKSAEPKDVGFDTQFNTLACAFDDGVVLVWCDVFSCSSSTLVLPEKFVGKVPQTADNEVALLLKEGFMCLIVNTKYTQVFRFCSGKYVPWKELAGGSFDVGFNGDIHQGLLLQNLSSGFHIWDLTSGNADIPLLTFRVARSRDFLLFVPTDDPQILYLTRKGQMDILKILPSMSAKVSSK